MRRQVFSLLVDNNPGVLSRIAGLFSRRGYSIDSITAGMTADPRFTRITVVASGDELILSQIEKQVRKLEDVREIKVLKDDESVFRELIMVKVRVNAQQRNEVISVADIFRAKIVDVDKESLMIELTGNQSKLEAFLNLLDGYEILELARTGITGLARGSKDVTYFDYAYLKRVPKEEKKQARGRKPLTIKQNCRSDTGGEDEGGPVKWQQKFIIRKTVTLQCWRERRSRSSDTEVRDMHMR